MQKREIVEKVTTQMFNNNKTTGIDVIIWVVRHAVYFPIFVTLVIVVLGAMWEMYLKEKTKKVAIDLDKPVVIRVDSLDKKVDRVKKTNAEIYYTVKTVERIQKRTAPKRVVEDVEEEVEIERKRDELAE